MDKDTATKILSIVQEAKNLGFNSVDVKVDTPEAQIALERYFGSTYPYTYTSLKGGVYEIRWPK